MLVKTLKSKLHRGRVTDVKLHYPGSIAVDSELMEAAGIMPYECVLVADLDTANRFETYIVPAPAGSRKISILGAAAQLVKRGDIVIIIVFGYCEPDEAKRLKPKILVLDENNNVIEGPE